MRLTFFLLFSPIVIDKFCVKELSIKDTVGKMSTTTTFIPLGPLTASSTVSSPASPASPANTTPPFASTAAQHPTIQTATVKCSTAQQSPGVHPQLSFPANPSRQSPRSRVLKAWGIPLAKAALGVATLVAAITAIISLRLSLWTAKKDFRDDCRSQNSTLGFLDQSCRNALAKPLSPPPFMNEHIAKSKRWLGSAAEIVSSMTPMGIATWDVRASAFLASVACSLAFAWFTAVGDFPIHADFAGYVASFILYYSAIHFCIAVIACGMARGDDLTIFALVKFTLWTSIFLFIILVGVPLQTRAYTLPSLTGTQLIMVSQQGSYGRAKFWNATDHPGHEELKMILTIREQLPVIRTKKIIMERYHGVFFHRQRLTKKNLQVDMA
nr:hypothetical protein LTR18_003639 [Exophiala xenobiotica]